MMIYDCEIINCIPSSDGDDEDYTYSYCKGWDDFEGMGISVVGFFYEDGTTGYWSDELSLRDLKKGIEPYNGRLMGFNSKNFDDRLLAANGIHVVTSYDLLEEIRIAAYGSSNWQDQPEGFYSLGAIARANNLTKTGSGTQAPKLWQQGMRQEVVDYCLNDTRITMQIYLLGVKGELIDPNTGANLLLPTAK